MLHLENGTNVSGKLKSCDEEGCVIDSRTVRLAEIALIEIHSGVKLPAGAQPRAVVMTDGTIAKGRFVSLSLGEVDTDAGELDRDDVALIVLGTIVAAPPPQPAPTTTREPDKPNGTRDGLWTGTIRARLWGTKDGITTTDDILVQVRLREYDPANGKIRLLRAENSVIENTMQCRGNVSCDGSGTVTISTRVDDNKPSVIYPQDRDRYVIGIPAHSDSKFNVVYTTAAGSSTSETDYMSPLIGHPPDPNVRYLDNGRMTGSYIGPAVGVFEHGAVSWMICREGVACPPAPPLP